VGWERAKAIELEGYAFVPRLDVEEGERRFIIRCNSAIVYDEVIRNGTGEDSVWARIEFDLPDHLWATSEDLVVSFEATELDKQPQGVKAVDNREIGFAIVSLRFIFPPQ
jgi:hypothetical protein